MAGHSQFKNIMYRKGAQDAKRAKAFTKIIREITVASKEGGQDPHTNPRLRAAIIAAREANLPRDTMERAIARGAGTQEGENFEEIRYEGYGPGGVAIIVETLTDNRNRTAPDMRAAFTKAGGSLGETNSVSFQFQHLGLIEYPLAQLSSDAIFEKALEAGAEDVTQEGDCHQIYCQANQLHAVRETLSKELGDPLRAKLVWKPLNLVPLQDEETAKSLLKLIDVLEDNDDVQTVFANFDIPETLLTKLGI